jgi:hypothetical protein
MMVVPLVVMTPFLAGSSSSSKSSDGAAIAKAVRSMAVSVATIGGVFGQFLLSPLLTAVAATDSRVAFTAWFWPPATAVVF